MSFAEQERALFDLMFDGALRTRFAAHGGGALSDYDLDPAERADFAAIRPDGLALDASLRADFLMAHFCRAFPLGCALASSLPGGMEALHAMVDAPLMRVAPVDRAATFGARLRERFAQQDFGSGAERAAAVSIAGAELGMAESAAALKHAIVNGGSAPAAVALPGTDRMDLPLRLATFAGAHPIPRPWVELQQALCPAPPDVLWNALCRAPLPAVSRQAALSKPDTRLLVARAQARFVSRCDPTVDLRTVELSAGFAPLFAHLDGRTSVNALLAQLRSAGAADALLQSIDRAFRQLLELGMIEAV